MIKNFLIIALRNIKRQKFYSFLNIFGLAIGIACSVLITLFVKFELSYDRFHEKSEQIYRVAVDALSGNTKIQQTYTASPMGSTLKKLYPEVKQFVRMMNYGMTLKYNEKIFKEKKIFLVDSTIFNVFTIKLISGNHCNALVKPNSIIVSESMAKKYFGNENPLGKVFVSDTIALNITGVFKDFPLNSHFHPDFFISIHSNFNANYANSNNWNSNGNLLYIVLEKNSSLAEFNKKLDSMVIKMIGKDAIEKRKATGSYWRFYLQPLSDIHLTSTLSGEFEPNGNIKYIYIFSLVAVFILLIACINFMNLATARATKRAKETGVRKILGSQRHLLIFQYLCESVFTSIIALVAGMGLVELFLPVFNDFIGIKLQMHYFSDLSILPLLIGLSILVGIISGSFPAFYLSAFNPLQALKSNFYKGYKHNFFRSILVIFQFIITIILFISTFVVFSQLKYFQNKKLGFDREQIIIVKNTENLNEKINILKTEYLKNSNIEHVTCGISLPGFHFINYGFKPENVEGGISLNLYFCDEDYAKTLDMKIVEGHFFSKEFPTDSSGIVLNQAAVKLLKWENPIGKKLNFGHRGTWLTVIGVANDFHYESLHTEIRPGAMILLNGTIKRNAKMMAVKIKTSDIHATINFLERTWKKITDNPFEYSFYNQEYDKLYKNEKQTGIVFIIFSLLSIIIAALGLLGLAAYAAEQRTKELAIRKVLGASAKQIVIQLNRNFAFLVLIANMIAWPVAWFLMSNWLETFAYRISFEWWMFVISGLAAFILATITVTAQVLKVAQSKPVDSLKFE